MQSLITLETLLALRSGPTRQALQEHLHAARDAGYQRALADVQAALRILTSPLSSPTEQIAYERIGKILEVKAHLCKKIGAPRNATDPSHGKGGGRND